jgi:glycosyl hydrolase family 20
MKNLTIVSIIIICLIPSAFSQTVSLRFNQTSQQQLYAASVLETALIKKGYKIKNAVSPVRGDLEGAERARAQVDLAINAGRLGAESFSIKRAKQTITITGGDERGLIYGCLSLAEDIRNGILLKDCRTKNDKPLLPFRAIKYDLPWDTYRHSYALELHDQTCRDTTYWKAFLDMMAENRFNTLTLWNLHPYTFLIKPKNFPEASPWNDKEMKEWQTLFHSIIRMATERAIETYIIPFNIFVTPEFTKAHNVAMDNLAHDYFVNADTSEIIKRYTRECVTQMLEEYPGLTGMGLTLGEGMGGMTPQQREDWITATIIEGMRLAKRKSKLIHRIPFSSTTGSAGPTSIETERLTRSAIEIEAAMGFTEGPIWADLKFNWSHAHSTTKLIKVHGGKLYDTYFKPEPTLYKIVWTARNEDFFCLRWGVPSFVRNHILQNTRSYSGGYIVGSETYIPAKDYFTRDSVDLPWHYAFERQWLFYKLWGRLMYDPNISDELFKKEFTRRYGNVGEQLLAASALAGNTPLLLASYFDCGWDFTLYSEGMMALDNTTKRVDYISVDRLINQPPLDTSYVSVADYVSRSSSAVTFDKKEITPPMLVSLLEKDCNTALKLVSKINVSGNKALRYEVADIRAWSYLGLHLAEKIRGAVALQTFRTRGGEANKEKAIKYLQSALAYWDSLINITRRLYRDMPLVHLSQQGGKESKENFYLTFHWEKLRPDVARDVEIAEEAVGVKRER